MENENRNYRIRTEIGNDAPNVINVKLNQTFDTLDILSLKIGQKNLYKMPAAPYGIVCGRVLLGGKSFGIQNAKVSIFIPKDGTVFNVKDDILYTYSSVDSINYEGVRYNLLPSYVDNACHQNIGSMFEKEYVLDNNDVIRIFDTYYTYTTSTNNAGDYFIYGVPVGQHTLHVDVDLSDIGPLSIRPHDMIGQGYNIDQFESPNKFKADKNLNILPQVKSQNKPIYIYPFWGDTSEDSTNATITRADIEIDYKFEPSAVFIGSIVTDKGSNSISHKCVADDKTGKMSELITGEGIIEMIRKTFDGKVEQFSVKANRLIDGDGVWCYQVPMNLDYVVMDEFGNIVPTDNPDKGIPTRARVRFRISLDENPIDDSARKRARFLVPNNPRLTDDYPNFEKTHEADYEFGNLTKEESYRDMFWNNVYTVKSYIPRLQKRVTFNTKKFTGIKMTNHAGDNNPMPYNNLSIKMNFMYRFVCVLFTVFIYLVGFINTFVLAPIGNVIIMIGVAIHYLVAPFRLVSDILDWIGLGDGAIGELLDFIGDIGCEIINVGTNVFITLKSGQFCEDGIDNEYILGVETILKIFYVIRWSLCALTSRCHCNMERKANDTDRILDCIQNALAQDNEVTSFNFQNDWINGVLYAPLWYRKIKPKRKLLFGLITTNSKDDWCDASSTKMASKGLFLSKGLKIYQTCAQTRSFTNSYKEIEPINSSKPRRSLVDDLTLIPGYTRNLKDSNCFGYKCHRLGLSLINVDRGIIVRKETKYGEYVYYYKAVEYDGSKLKNINDGNDGEIKILFASDLVLLGSLNDCDSKGVPQFFKHLNETTYNMPPDLVSLTYNVLPNKVDINGEDGNIIETEGSIDNSSVHTKYSGADWGSAGFDQWNDKERTEDPYVKLGGNEHDNGGLFYDMNCNFSYVKPKSCVNLSRICEFGVTLDQSITFKNGNQDIVMPPDGFISYDELYNPDARAMFATMNGNRLRTKQDPKTGFPTYDFNYIYPENFDGTLKKLMEKIPNNIIYSDNDSLELSSDGYVRFRYGYQINPNDFKISFYNSNDTLKIIYPDENKDRFPRYENSFYFYFGLKSGKTAIDKFRKNFYSECTNDAEAESVVLIDYVPNSWCMDVYGDVSHSQIYNPSMLDGYISFDLSNLEHPCTIEFNDRNIVNNDDSTKMYFGIYSNKLYIGQSNQELENDGYTRLSVDGNGRQKPERTAGSTTTYTPAYPPSNDYYVLSITEANGEVYRQNISFIAPKLEYDVLTTDFTLTNDGLIDRFQTSFDPIYDIASDTEQSDNPNYKRKIGGYITITNLVNGDEPMTDFEITISGSISGYIGSIYTVIGGVGTPGANPTVPPIVTQDGEYVFGVPRGDEYYDVTVTQFCASTNQPSQGNSVTTRVFVSQPKPLKMFINGIDTDLLLGFRTGYQQDSDGVISAPYAGYNPSVGITPGHVEGWLNIDNVGVTNSDLIDGVTADFNDVQPVITKLSYTYPTIPYSFTAEYMFDENTFEKNLYTFQTPEEANNIPEPKPKYVRIRDPFDGSTLIYELNATTREYDPTGDIDITIQQYFEMGDEQAQEVIDALNDITQRRLDLVQNMIDAFWLCDNGFDSGKDINVTSHASNTPVSTIIYHIEDGATRYTGYKAETENSILSIPTIIPNEENTKPIFNKVDSNNYKLPPYCAIKDNMDVTVGKNLGTIPFSANNTHIPSIIRQVPGGMDGSNSIPVLYNMFGFHIIDKTPFTKVNIWIPMSYPMYMPDVDMNNVEVKNVSEVPGETVGSEGWLTPVDTLEDEPNRYGKVYHIVDDPDDKYYIWKCDHYEDAVKRGEFFDLNGCVSGYFYNGFSTSNNREAQFTTQKIENIISLFTITVDGNGKPNEFAIPTKRLLYNYKNRVTDESKRTYNDYINPYDLNNHPTLIGNFDDINDGMQLTETDGTGYRYISYSKNAGYLTISDDHTTFNEDLLSDSTFGVAEDTVVCPGRTISTEFRYLDNNENRSIKIVHYRNNGTNHNNLNPIYTKVFSNSPDLINQHPVYMSYNDPYYHQSGHYNTFSISQNDKTVFFVGVSPDGKYRGISPTYEIDYVNFDWKNTPDSDQLMRFRLKFKDGDVNDYYLKYYTFDLILTMTQSGEELSRIEGIRINYDNLQQADDSVFDKQTDWFPFENTTWTSYPSLHFFRIYIKDITGIRRVNNPNIGSYPN